MKSFPTLTIFCSPFNHPRVLMVSLEPRESLESPDPRETLVPPALLDPPVLLDLR